MASDDPTELSRRDGLVAAYVHVLCDVCDNYMNGERNSRRDCSHCTLTVAVGCEVEQIESDIAPDLDMEQPSGQTEVPVTIEPTLMCHDCTALMDNPQSGLWTCPSCGVRATVQSQAEVIDDGA